MARPKAGDEGWQEYKAAKNERRRRRREDPAYKAMEYARQRASVAKRKAEEASRQGKTTENDKES